ncbi:CRTAC1 family protein [Exilibacterium tricleocarpae]|uniref:CRTAC1 family protein n=1 Tax=Exilibacterium tricleocarpae TaxID=2591008 RepID=A0A545U5D7_9GAMM|nr:CRTAC1 family protein [Exilibacterium tricleocarpae]TQV84677.1 CRTAC1 family protein [Exilibacterium tricleocarpae]
MKSLLTFILPVCVFCLAACGGGGGGGTAVDNGNNVDSGGELRFSFTDMSADTGLMHAWGIENPTANSMPEMFAGGVGAGDFDNDGLTDLYFAAGDTEANRLFRNQGDNRFVEITGIDSLVMKGSGPIFCDFDGDGLEDIFVGGVEGDPNYLLQNAGNDTFNDVTATSGLTVTVANTISAACGDYDLDGDLDLALAHWGAQKQADTQHIWENTSGGGAITFASASVATGIAATIVGESQNGVLGDDDIDYSFTPTFADLNNDGFPDLAMVSDFSQTQVFLNNQDGTFRNVTNDVIKDRNGMGSAIGDIDNDGDLDWFVTAIFNVTDGGNVLSIGNRLYKNLGNGEFTDVTVTPAGVDRGGWGWAACMADFDNDGLLDLFHTNGWDNEADGDNYETDQVRLFLAEGDGSYREVASRVGLDDTGHGRGVVCADFDVDGDVDILITNNNPDGQNSVVYYRNDSEDSDNHYLGVRLNGIDPNRAAVGARIYITLGQETQMREVMLGGNYASNNPVEQHFGLGQAATIDQVRVVWPRVIGSDPAPDTLLNDIPADQFLTIDHPAL